MKKIYTFAALLIAGIIGLTGSAKVFAQSYVSNLSNSQQIGLMPNTCSNQDTTTSISRSSNTSNGTGSILPDYAVSYQDSVNDSLSNSSTSIYPVISVTPSTFVTYPTISYQGSEPVTITTAPMISADYCAVSVDSPTQYPYANLTTNDTGIAYVMYDGSVTLNWNTYGMDSCTVEPISQSGTSGQYELKNITSNTTVTLNCNVSSDYPNYSVFPTSVQIKVLPPTFEYLKSFISQIQPIRNKKVNLNSVSNFIDQAQKASKTSLAQSFLQKSIDSLKQQGAKGVISTAQITKYEQAAHYLSKTLPVKVVITVDSCSVTATGPAGLIMQYGANENERRGYGEEVTIPTSGTITASIHATSGWQATAEVIDSTGLIYARDTKDVTTDNCPFPPVVYDPSTYNGYPEKWAVPEVGTVIDDWGYYNKTAESYVAFRVTNAGKTLPAGYGNASDWLAKATVDGYVVDYPQAGDIAINTLDASFGGPIAWYIDSVDGLGNYQTSAIRSDGNMNWSGGTVSGSSYLKYIRLP